MYYIIFRSAYKWVEYQFTVNTKNWNEKFSSTFLNFEQQENMLINEKYQVLMDSIHTVFIHMIV